MLFALPACGQIDPHASVPATNQYQLIVRFEPRERLGQAQALYARNQFAEAEEAARTALAQDPRYAGLCFTRFALGGEEVILEACEWPVSGPDVWTATWVDRLRSDPGVVFVEPNYIAAIEGQPASKPR